MHPHHAPHSRPPRPSPCAGFLVQKIIACEKRHLPCVVAECRFDPCACGSVQSVSACGQPAWALQGDCRLRVTLPLSVCLSDSCGRRETRAASVEVETELPRAFPGVMDDPRNTLLILPCVRLLRAECICSGSYRLQLAVSLDIYLLRYEMLHCGQPAPQCPQLPLYPQPMC